MKSDLAQIRRAHQLLYPEGGVLELRVIRGRANGVISGFFDNADALGRAIAGLNGHAVGAYITLSRVNAPLLARMANRVHWPGPSGAKDTDIPVRDNLLFDFDAVRPSDISATDAEHAAGIERAWDAMHWLQEEYGWPPGVVADSGNGGHLIFRIRLPNEPWATELIRRVLRAVAARFNDATVVVDESVHNASRITKLPGTWACKGDSTADRPHRQAAILSAPEALVEVTREQLEAVAARAPEEARAPKTGNPRNVPFDIEAWMREYYIPFRAGVPYEGGVKYVLDECPYNSDHRAPDSAIFQLASGAIVFKCLHNSCSQYGWRELREKFERPAKHQTVREMRTAETKAAAEAVQSEPLDALVDREIPMPEQIIVGLFTRPGLSMIVGPPKAGKTIFGVQAALSIAAGEHLLGWFNTVQTPSLIIQQDDRMGAASLKDIRLRSRFARQGSPCYFVTGTSFTLGDEFSTWLGTEIRRLRLGFVLIDSYTALRPSRKGGVDIVKAEAADLIPLSDLARALGCSICLVHHDSKSSQKLDWSDRAAGSFAIGANVDSLIFVSRFADAPEQSFDRLVRARGRHIPGNEFVITFRRDSLDYDFVVDGPAAVLWPEARQIQAQFGAESFTAKDITGQLGWSRPTSYRILQRLTHAGTIRKQGHSWTWSAQTK